MPDKVDLVSWQVFVPQLPIRVAGHGGEGDPSIVYCGLCGAIVTECHTGSRLFLTHLTLDARKHVESECPKWTR